MPLRLGRILAALTVLFSLRVLGQVRVAFCSVPWLPSMEQWCSGRVPYPMLLVIQLAMVTVMMKLSIEISRGAGRFAKQHAGWSAILVSFSASYAGGMA